MLYIVPMNIAITRWQASQQDHCRQILYSCTSTDVPKPYLPFS